MEFKITYVDQIPAAALRATSHSFPWDDMVKGLEERGKSPQITVTKDYWVKRGISAKDYDVGAARERIRASYRGWQDRDPNVRYGYQLSMRSVDENVEVFLKKAATPTRQKGGSVASKAAPKKKKKRRLPSPRA